MNLCQASNRVRFWCALQLGSCFDGIEDLLHPEELKGQPEDWQWPLQTLLRDLASDLATKLSIEFENDSGSSLRMNVKTKSSRLNSYGHCDLWVTGT